MSRSKLERQVIKQIRRGKASRAALNAVRRPPRVMDFENSDGHRVNVDGLLVTAFEAAGDLVCLHFESQCVMIKESFDAVKSWLERLKALE